jgi:hypothetical protein
MTLSERIKRWWNPAQWRDDHPEYSEGSGFALGHKDQLRNSVPKPRRFQGASDSRSLGRYRRR